MDIHSGPSQTESATQSTEAGEIDGSSDEAALLATGMQMDAHKPWAGFYRIHKNQMFRRPCFEHFDGGTYIYFDGNVWKFGKTLDPEDTSDVYSPDSSEGELLEGNIYSLNIAVRQLGYVCVCLWFSYTIKL
jgi:hypothetical protein